MTRYRPARPPWTRRAPVLVTALLLIGIAACGGDAREARGDDTGGVGATDEAGATGGPGGAADAAARAAAAAAAPRTSEWPDDIAAAVNLHRERIADLTADGAAERVVVSARGTRYDSLEIGLVIRSAAGDTLWADGWSSRHYFQYDPLEGKADSTVARIVRAHVDTLLHDSRFSRRGPPLPMDAGTVRGMAGESVGYHLAELDWRNAASLTPAERTPPHAHDRIVAGRIAPERVRVVVAELMDGPTFMYYAGGEASYVLGWSVREHAFVRLFSCC